jgi:hypothetical protein
LPAVVGAAWPLKCRYAWKAAQTMAMRPAMAPMISKVYVAAEAAGSAGTAFEPPPPPTGSKVGWGVVSGVSVAAGVGVGVGVTEGVEPSEALCEGVAVTEGVAVGLAVGPKKTDSVLSPAQLVCPWSALHTMMVQHGSLLQGTPTSRKTGELVVVEKALSCSKPAAAGF